MQTIHVEHTDETIQKIARASFPAYNGRLFQLAVSDSPIDVRSYWDGGSRSYFVFVNLATMQASQQVPAQSAFDAPINGADSVQLPEGFACVEHSIFCGKDMGLTIHILPANAAKLIPPTVELTREQRIVLIATHSYKNTYAGTSNYRFVEAHSETGITAIDWETAKASLIASGHLNNAGALTIAGKNAIPQFDNLYKYRKVSQ